MSANSRCDVTMVVSAKTRVIPDAPHIQRMAGRLGVLGQPRVGRTPRSTNQPGRVPSRGMRSVAATDRPVASSIHPSTSAGTASRSSPFTPSVAAGIGDALRRQLRAT